MTLQEAFIDALRAIGEPAHLKDIHAKHRALGGAYTHRGLATAASVMMHAGQIARLDTPHGPLFTLPHNALARARKRV